ncbi:Similar to Cdcp2: CUB domain-containing protein 2 (Mus musculus) [Cotesia congregata]|uniref:Similar to Cdcp2: CUB domain-containing protein 2 (Mus musculus) n=1 Tax=Cotesia congregata TaxID=51543 RepID=A0A8J2HTP3_COTCN|nr:Similar to Cdcp2: CUB domain-containing protein 2 (Mus musculus) [Cotesia congregata]
MLVIRRLLIVGVLAASIGHYPVAAATGSKIGGMWWWWRPPWFISYLGFALIFHTTPDVASYHIAVTTSSSSSSQKTDLTAAGCRLSEFRSCNRTLYGDVGRTYEVEVRRPREDRLPFICHINFTAAGGDFGDLVQLTFDTFTVGRFLSFTNQGCPDGFMMIREEGRPATGGQWCGSAWGYTVYYSETASINLTLYLARLSEQGIGYNFDFKLSYKFLKRSEAHLRYGNNTLSTWRGDLVNGTYCDRVLTRCDTRACRLQSPNYPGVYPRNVTCYYRIEHKRAPPGHRALLAVNQRNSHKIHIKDQVVKYDRSQRILRVWDQCNVVQDYLTVYDGGSTTDRVLVRLCGGDTVPDIVSSRNTMLLEFHTSPYDNPFHPVPLSFLPGFELEVHVLFVDDKSRSFVKENSNCDFYITSYENPSGTLENPKHSLPPNTTCRYHFHGKPNEIVWISFIKYYSASTDPPPAASIDSLNNDDDSNNNNNDDLLRNSSRHTRPCSLAESYVSTGRDLTLEHILRQGSALYPISFVLRYEFVHNSMSCHLVFTSSSSFSFSSSFLGGSSRHDESVVKKSAGISGKFSSPKNVFLYGRGGAQNLSCVYRFEAEQDQKVEISISRASFGDKVCMSYVDPLVNRWTCDRRTSDVKLTGLAELVVSEYPWPGVKLVRDCFCSNITGNADNDSSNNNYRVSLTSLTSNIVELKFTITRMNVTQDYNDFFFEGEYRFVSNNVPVENNEDSDDTRNHGNEDDDDDDDDDDNNSDNEEQKLQKRQQQQSRRRCPSRLEDRKLRGTSGEISLKSPLLSVRHYDGSDFGKTTGSDVAAVEEILKNTDDLTTTAIATQHSPITQQHARSFVVEFIQKEPGTYSVMWIAISKSARAATDTHYFNTDGDNSAGNIFSMVPPIEDCPYRCPEIKACISSVLWCDGIKHCPSGFDEEEINCSYRFGVTLLYVAVGAGILGVFLVLLLATGCLKYCLYRHKIRTKKKKKKKKNSLNSLNVNNIHVNHMHHHHNNGLTSSSQLQSGGGGAGGQYNITSHPQDLYTSDNYGKDSIC